MAPDLNIDELQKQADEASEKKSLLGAFGGALQNVASVPTAYEQLHLGGQSRGPNIKGMFDSAAGMIKDPWEKQKKTYEMYQAAKQNKDAQRQAGIDDQMDAPDSQMAKAYKASLLSKKMITPEQAKNMTMREAMTALADPRELDKIQAKAQIDMQNDMQKLRFGKQADLEKMRVGKEYDLERANATKNTEKHRFDNMPEDQKELVTGLSKKNANKVAISSQIDSVMGILDDKNVKDDQKLMQARQLIKTLNSTEGQDAVGAEEAKRLAGMLEFNFFNITEPGAFFGRDLKGFGEQAKTTSKALKNSIGTNQALIDKAMGRSSGDQSVIHEYVNAPTEKDKKALSWAMANPNDPRAAAIMEKNKSKIGAR